MKKTRNSLFRFGITMLIITLLISMAGCAQATDVKASETPDPFAVTDDIAPPEPSSGEGDPENAPDSQMSAEQAEVYGELKKYLAEKPAELGFQGTIIVELGDDVLLKESYGLADKATKTPNNINTIYEVGEITWQFTTAAIMLLAEKGALSLDDTIDQYIPDYPYGSKITVKHLMQHRSGISGYFFVISNDDSLFNNYYGVKNRDEIFQQRMSREVTNQEIVSLISNYNLLFEPNQSTTTSSTNYYFLGMIVEKVSGMAYEEFIKKNIFEPLEMSSSSYDPMNTTAVGYALKDSEELPAISWHPSISYAHTGLCTSAEDLMKWENAVINRKILREESWKEVFTGFKVTSYKMGYGWYIHDYGSYTYGNTNGFNSYALVNRSNKLKVVVLTNRGYNNSSMGSQAEAVADFLVRRVNSYVKDYPDIVQ